MVVAELIIAVLVFLGWLGARFVNTILGYVYLFIIFIFSYVVGNREFSVFYLLVLIIALVIELVASQVSVAGSREVSRFQSTVKESSSFRVGQTKLSGFTFTGLQLVIGLVMYITISIINKTVGGNILGTPNLAVTTSGIGSLFKPTFQAMLGILENQIAYAIFSVINAVSPALAMIPFAGALFIIPLLMPVLIAALVLGILHVAAYSVAVGLILWAMGAFAAFIIARYFFHDGLAGDTAHWLNNLINSIGRGLTLVR